MPPPSPDFILSDTPGTALPAQIGKYRVLAKLGEGATSEVFLARDDFHGVEVAIKRVRTAVLSDSRESHFQRRFFAAEAALVGRLQHPNVVRILDAVSEVDEPPYLVMEFVPGSTLRKFCRADALLPLDQIVEIGFKCAMALDYMFRQGLIHRDVKPANLLATLDGDHVVDVKITDFGSVFNLDADRTQIYRVGSLAYMSPEQLDGDTLDCRADIYSLAGVLYHLIAGRPPFDAVQQAAIMHQIYTATPPPLQGLREGVSPALEALILRALSKNRDERPANWEEFAQALSALVANRDVPRGQLQGVLDSERFNLLRKLEFFTGFGDVELWEVVHRAKWQRFSFGHALYRKGQEGNSFHIIALGQVDVYRDGQRVAQLGAGNSVGEMAYLAPSPDLRVHSADILVSDPLTCISFTPDTLQQLSINTRHLFDNAFIRVLVRRLHAAHEALAHPRRIL
ncbi:serine/threonine-protein kinase [Rubrivivax sp. RP6-9]|uniref:serine/threonine-protein kinase n=1 Tax=Rubrivivax sp. RP6-9 TaxID=3415750 RepID=UPI003CC530B7